MAQNSDIESQLKPLRLRYKLQPQNRKLILRLVDAIQKQTGKQCQYSPDGYENQNNRCLSVVPPDRHFCDQCGDKYWSNGKGQKRTIRDIQKQLLQMKGLPQWRIDGFNNEEDWKLYKQAQEALS